MQRSRLSHSVIASGVLLLLAVNGCMHTQPFVDTTGKAVPGSIATMETETINGIPQSLWFRGVSTANPALILLHGGPGASESALFRHYNAALEQHFLVVYWDQRGAGRSYHADIPPASMTIERFLSDLDQVVDRVRRRFHQNKVVLLGHSWGTVLGTLYAYQHPDKVAAYVAVAPLVDKRKQDRLSYEFALAEASKRDNQRALAELRAIDPVLHTVDDELTLGTWVERFGGTFFDNKLSTGKLIWAALTTDETDVVDLMKFGQGNRFSLESLWPEYSQVDVTGYRSFAMPIFFLLGRYDWHVPSVVAAQYFETIQAPFKRLVWFEHSAHNPPFEEPEKFNTVLRDEVLPLLVDQSADLSCNQGCWMPGTLTGLPTQAAKQATSWNY